MSSANSGAKALALVDAQVFDVCFLDISIGEESGLELLPKLRAIAPWLRY